MGIKKSRKPVKFIKESSHESAAVVAEVEVRPEPEVIESSAKIIPLPIFDPYLLNGIGKNGAASLTAVFPNTTYKGTPLRINLSFLLRVPNLTEPLSEYYLKSQGNAPKRTTARTQAVRLSGGLTAFLTSTGRTHIALSGFDVSMTNAYLGWLDRADSEGNAVIVVASRSVHYAMFKNIVRILRESQTWGQYIPPSLEFPDPPWVGQGHRGTSTPVINAEHMTLIRLKCIELVKETIHRFYETKQLIENYGPLPPLSTKGREWTLEKFLVLINDYCSDGPILAQSKLPKRLAIIAKTYGWGDIRNDIAPRFHAVTASLVPFIILMAIPTAYNPDTIRNSLLSDFTFDDTFGNWFVANAFKGRGGAEQPVYIPVDDAYDNPAMLYRFVVEYTARVRKFAPPDSINKLFIGSSRLELSTIIDVNIGLWPYLLSQFIKQHSLPVFTLQSIRPTVLDVTADVYDGDLKAMQIQANHKRPQTTYTHYTSDAKKQKDYERLGRIQQLKHRWRESNGVIDSRDRSTDEDLNCATPGWGCADPFDSPFSPKGKMCISYGQCPRCPLGRVDLNSPLAFAFTIALREAVNRAQQSMAAETWLTKMGAVKKAIEQKWLPSFTPFAVEAARHLHIPKLPIPE